MAKELARRLSYQDAAFWNFERDTMPMNVGSVGIYEGAIAFDDFVKHVDRRIDQVPRYRQRLMHVPFDLGFPAWIDDVHFDIYHHVEHVRVEAPGNDEQLRQLAAAFFSTPLPRDRPLWEIRLVEGLSGGRTAHLAKVHHCLVDGIGGVGLLAALLDAERRTPIEVRQPPPPPRPQPRPAELAADAIYDGIIDQLRLNERIARAMLEPETVLRGAQAIARGLAASWQYLVAPAPHMPWNMRLNGPTRVAWQNVRFEEVHAVAKTLGGTINDVVLTAVAGAAGRYLEASGHNTKDLVMRIAVPVNVRAEHEDEALGNRVSFMLFGALVGERDPIKRFSDIHAQSTKLKNAGQATGLDDLLRVVGASPAAMHATLGQVLSLPNPWSNMICTNVPGPLQPLYLMGHRMTAHYPWVPLGWRMGLSVAVMSYDDGLYFSFSGDRYAPDDVESVASHLGMALRELREAAGVPPAIPGYLATAPALASVPTTEAGFEARAAVEAPGGTCC